MSAINEATVTIPLAPVAGAGLSSTLAGKGVSPDENRIGYCRSPASEDAGAVIYNGDEATKSSQAEADKKHRRKRLINFITLCYTFILEGWNDGSLGPLIPRIQQYYKVICFYTGIEGLLTSSFKISYAIVSLIFVFECVVSYVTIIRRKGH